MGFIETYTETFSFVYDSPRKFLEAMALSLISTSAGRKTKIESTLSVSIKDIMNKTYENSGSFLNLWFLLIGKSRVARKSTVMNKAKEIIREVRNDVLIPPGFTPQALNDLLSQRAKKDKPESLWIYDECSGFFENIRKQYMSNTKELLSSIYDCNHYGGEMTIGRGTKEVERSYLNIIMGGTEHTTSFFDENYMYQGFANRFIYVNDEKSSFKPRGEKISNEYIAGVSKLVSWLRLLSNHKEEIRLQFTKEALKLLNDFDLLIDERIMSGKDESIYQGWIGNMPNIVVKLSANFCLSDYFDETNQDDIQYLLLTNEAKIEKRHVQRAIDRMKEAFEDYKYVVKLIKSKKQSKPILTDEQELDMVYDIISSHPNGIMRSDLYKKTKMFKVKQDKILDTLIAQKIIKIFGKDSTGGRRPTVYKAIKQT